MKTYIYEARMEVRDYECDIQGIVNNANYLHYTEHTRHLFLQSEGLSFARLHAQNIDVVVARMSLKYTCPLRCDDRFASRLWIEKEGIRYVFHHDLYRLGDEKLCFRATADIVCLVNGALGASEMIDNALAKYIK